MLRIPSESPTRLILYYKQRGKPAASLQPGCTPPQIWPEQVKKAPAGSSRKSWASRIASMHVLLHWATLVAQTVKCLPTTREDLGSIPGSGRSPGEGNDSPLQYPYLGNSMDGGAW